MNLAVPAPVAFFAFNRPEHTRRTLAALAANALAPRTALHVFVDGPRREAERASVEAVAAIANSASGFASVQVHVAAENRGLFSAITSGVSSMLARSGSVIVLEDDVLVSPSFLEYMNDALVRYQSEARVACVHAYSPPITGLPDYFFLRGGDCWGWATWSDRWALFRNDATDLLAELVARGELQEFTASHGWQSLLLLARRALGKNQSWAIQWHASLYLAGRLTLHPGYTFVRNIGVDGSGMHSGSADIYASKWRESYPGLPELAIESDAYSASRLARFMDGSAVGVPAAAQAWLRRQRAMLEVRRALRTTPRISGSRP